MGTVTSVGSGNYNTGSTWDSGARPGSSDDVVIANGHNVTLVQAENANSLDLQSGGTLDGDGNLLTIDGEDGSGYAINLDGTISGTDTDFAITTAAATNVDLVPSSGTIRNLTINHASAVVNIRSAATTISGDLTITAGTLDTQNSGSNLDLTVAGDTTGAGTLTLNNSTYTGGGSGSNLAMLGTVTIGTSGVITNVDELGTVSGSGGTITATGSPTLGHRRLRQLQSKWTAATSTLKLENGTNAIFGNDSTYAIPHHFELDNSGNTVELDGNFTVAGNMTITAGTLDTSSSNNRSLTVGTNTDDGGATGHLLILDAGELVCNSSTVIVGSVYCQIAAGSSGTGFSELNLPDASGSFTVRGPEKNGYVFRLDNQAECNHNSGTVTFSLTAENHPSIMDVTSLRGTGVNNILVTQTVSSSSTGGVLEFVGSDTVKGNLTLTGNGSESCIVDTNFNGASLTVDGDVTVNNHSTLIRRTTNTGNYSFGSLTIASGGTYQATSGTTTITNIESGASRSFLNNGTFTHNNGTVLFNGSMDQKMATNATGLFNNITLNKSNNDFVFIDSSTTVQGDLDITMADNTRQCRPSSTSGTITVLGNVIVREGIMLRSANDCSGNMEFGGLILESGGIYGTTSGTTKINGVLRNIGGTIN